LKYFIIKEKPMPFQVSPGVNVSEIDLTTVVPAVATTTGAIAGVFNWGPVENRTLISSEIELANVFGKPTANNFETFYSAANFLAYGNQLYVSRAASTTNYNAVANTSGGTANSNVTVKNITDFEAKEATLETSLNNFVAKYPGTIGNSLQISICPSSDAYSSPFQSTSTCNVQMYMELGSNMLTINCVGTGATTVASSFGEELTMGDYILIGNSTIGTQYVQVATANSTVVNSTNVKIVITTEEIQKLKTTWNYTASDNAIAANRYWEFFNFVNGAPGTSSYVAARNANTVVGDQLHIAITDNLGLITGTPGQMLEIWPNLSRASDAKSEQGASIFYRDVLKNNSSWVWPATDMLGIDTAVNLSPVEEDYVTTETFGGGGTDDTESTIAPASIMTAYDQYISAADVDISLVLAGKAYGGTGEQIPNYIIDNICEARKDCVVFISPPSSSVVNVPGQEATNVVAFRNLLRSTSYAVLDSGVKYQYDKYNDKYRWVPLNGDIAGLCVRTDSTRDPWYSPAGFNRGQIKNIIKLAYNPNQADRDLLYKNSINPVVNFPGQGVVLYGDKTLLARPSAFDRINVRRLFIVLEKAIATAAQSSLFEFNDAFTQAAFRNLVEPYLRDIQGRRGITDFRVVCDSTNNTPEVVDANQFVGDIYIKPARSINFIQLNFVAVRTGVDFTEIVGSI
jgi:phage tail sheath protein FI